ncbi:serine/threonine protein kinase [Paenibacillus sp. CGMCC 1.16610]|uniref:Serine/threonine-protein kinase n=2 Tax=Paenibacillus TaxID=44249 RepID=A0ABU6DGJ9_9BACL|nr:MULTISPECIES: serine/threonine-protein kinase [Paenibacillus]MBA2940982.1 serine/threonine protein kinase [Paenibacillus sp. CGMCC 1.16610]MCY9662794.1 serine/threonine-protein kinase [Paenibacillus anseongense]MEB4796794.1 serine/threonine-protein kinase [Paenibacillus chondroitinus]MVQ38828.1 serine/threonine protein kinase [Paenibacillus anseongense]
MTTWYEEAFRPGTEIQGKWNGRSYVVERLLGAGSNGVVVLVRRGTARFALKAGHETVDHQSEINSLLAISLTDTSFKNFLIDADDMQVRGKEISFYVMRYIDGMTISHFIHKRGQDWIYVIGSNLLRKLTEIHKSGYVFGDLKIENMIVSKYGDVDLIDFGGVTPKGRAIKQLTEVYDRGYWKMGERVAEESYDLFSFAILLLKSLDQRKRFTAMNKMLPQNRDVDQLMVIMRENSAAAQIAPFLQKALRGEFTTSQEAFHYWKKLISGKKLTQPALKMPWLKICFAASIFIFAATVYVYWPN